LFNNSFKIGCKIFLKRSLYNTGVHEPLQMLHELKFYYQHKINKELLQENFTNCCLLHAAIDTGALLSEDCKGEPLIKEKFKLFPKSGDRLKMTSFFSQLRCEKWFANLSKYLYLLPTNRFFEDRLGSGTQSIKSFS
jgi:hypothetical protein